MNSILTEERQRIEGMPRLGAAERAPASQLGGRSAPQVGDKTFDRRNKSDEDKPMKTHGDSVMVKENIELSVACTFFKYFVIHLIRGV